MRLVLTIFVCQMGLFVSSCFITQIHCTIPFPTDYTYNTMPTRSDVLTLIPPSSAINVRRHSFFICVCFVIPINILEIEIPSSLRHAAYKHFYAC